LTPGTAWWKVLVPGSGASRSFAEQHPPAVDAVGGRAAEQRRADQDEA
jgi:hypothetical protein